MRFSLFTHVIRCAAPTLTSPTTVHAPLLTPIATVPASATQLIPVAAGLSPIEHHPEDVAQPHHRRKAGQSGNRAAKLTALRHERHRPGECTLGTALQVPALCVYVCVCVCVCCLVCVAFMKIRSFSYEADALTVCCCLQGLL